MKKIFYCRRSSLALISILILGGVMAYKGMDMSVAMASIVGLIGASNAYSDKVIGKRKGE